MTGGEAAVVLLCVRAEVYRRAGARDPREGIDAAWRSLHEQVPAANDIALAQNVFTRARALADARRECPPGAWFDGSLSLLEQAVEAAMNALWSAYAAVGLEPDRALRLGMLPLSQWEWMQDTQLDAAALSTPQECRALLESPLATLWIHD